MVTKLTLLGLNLVGRGCVSACGQRGGEQDIRGGRLVLRVGEAGLSAPAAQGLIRKGALQSSSGGLQGR